MFKIGQKVVCKNNKGTYPKLDNNGIYTISSFNNCPGCGVSMVELVEIVSSYYTTECTKCGKNFESFAVYRTDRFEPLKYDLLDNKDIISELIEEKADIKIPELVEN